MSKFINNIKAELTGKRTVDPIPLLQVSVNASRESVYSTHLQYTISVEYGIKVSCLPEDIGKMKDNLIAQLRDEIYGDFRKKAYALQRAAYSGSREEIIRATDALMGEVLG